MSSVPFRIDVLIPTCDRPAELAATLAGLAAQEGVSFQVTVSDQSSGEPSFAAPAAAAMVRVLERRGHPVVLHRHLPRRGMSEHRAFLLSCAEAPHVLFLDDDIWTEPGTLARLHAAITTLGCGFVGAAMTGLSHLDDRRPAELAPYEEWDGPPLPEVLGRDSPAYARWTLHNAANPTHLADRLDLAPGEWRAYKVAWIAGCVLYERQALLDAGGFDFWERVPEHSAGEEVAAQWQVMALRGGAGILPGGAVHLESPTTVTRREGEAYDVLAEAAAAAAEAAEGAGAIRRPAAAGAGAPRRPAAAGARRGGPVPVEALPSQG